jgi:hypothetical protein
MFYKMSSFSASKFVSEKTRSLRALLFLLPRIARTRRVLGTEFELETPFVED